jgi:RND family efflux transporter MFP subunit
MGREQEGKAQTTPTPVEVTTAIALRETFELELPCNGQVEAARTARVCFETQGIISGVHVANGQVVKAGDLLASLDDAEPQLALQRAKLQLERAALEKKNLLLGYSPAQDTSKLSKEIVQTVEIRSGYTEAQLAVREAELKLSKTRLVAPVAGRVVDLKAKAHNPTSSYDFLCNIIDESSLQVAFNVLESELDMAAVGANVVVTPLTQAGHKSLGRITEVNRKVDNNGLISVVASLNEPNNALIPGMNVRVMVTSQLPNRLVIPLEGLTLRQNRDVVFTVKDSLAVWNYVQVGHRNSRQVEIIEGLKEGDRVIVSGNATIGHEAWVKVEPSSNSKP